MISEIVDLVTNLGDHLNAESQDPWRMAPLGLRAAHSKYRMKCMPSYPYGLLEPRDRLNVDRIVAPRTEIAL